MLTLGEMSWVCQPVRAGDTGGSDGVTQPDLEAAGGEVSAGLDEHEIRRATVTRVWERAMLAAVSEPGVERFERDSVERDRSLGVQFAERHEEPASRWPVGNDREGFLFLLQRGAVSDV